MTTNEVSEILKKHGLKNNRLHNLELSKWKEGDFKELEKIKQGIFQVKKERKTRVFIRVVRVLDGKIYDSITKARVANGILSKSGFYQMLNEENLFKRL